MRPSRTPFLATRPASPRDYLGAASVILIVLGICGAIAPVGNDVPGIDNDLMDATLIASIVCQAGIAFLLYGQWRASRHSAIGFLSIAFAFSALMYATFWAEYPEIVSARGLVPISPGHVGYFWTVGHLGTFLLLGAFVASARRIRPADKAVIFTAIGTALFAIGFIALMLWKSDLFPRLALKGEFLPLNSHVLHPIVLGAGLALTVAVVWVTRLQRWVDVFVALFATGLVAEAYLLAIGPQQYSFGWYGSHWAIAIASFGVGVPLIREVNRLYRQLTAENRRLARAAMVDPLTGIANRRAFDAQIEQLDVNTVLLIIDIDRFKNYNDLEGHRAGDDCIRRVARALAANVLRSDDLIARYGGDEFAAILHDIDLDDAIHVAERIRLAVADLSIPAHEEGAKITVSIGLAAYMPGENSADLLRRADDALYRAKEGGRNRVAFDEETTLETL